MQLAASTTSIWVKADPDVTVTRYIFSDSTANSGYACFIEQSTGYLGCTINNSIPVSSGVALNDNAWHHVALVISKSPSNATVYIDGTAYTPASVLLTSNANPILLGQSSITPGSNPFLGLLDDLRIYNRPLPQGEITTLAAGTGPDSIVRGTSAAITVGAGAAIIVQPRGMHISAGQSAALSVTATGSGTLSYQWYQGASGDTTSLIPGATSNTYTTPVLNNPASYWVRVTGIYGQPVNSTTAQVITSAVAGSFSNLNPITIADNTVASPYPSSIDVSGVTGSFDAIRVSLTNVNHTRPNDIGILLVGPLGQKVVLMDAAGGGVDLVNVNLAFDDLGNALTTAAISSGTYRPTNLSSTRTYPAPAPATPYASALSAFNGIDPNGTWQLFVRDAVAGETGSILGGWAIEFLTLQGTQISVQPQNMFIVPGESASLSVTAITSNGPLGYQWYQGASGDTTSPIAGATTSSYTTPPLYGPATYWVRITDVLAQTFNSTTAQLTTAFVASFGNNASITINDLAAATPYPSTIDVAGYIGVPEKIRVSLNGVNHTYPADIGVLLVGPQGQKVVLMDAAGAAVDLVSVNLVFDDSGSALTNAAISSGTYRPTNLNTARTFPAPAPAKPYASALSAFSNIDPNGTWQLYVRDAEVADIGSIVGGWQLELINSTYSLKVVFSGNGQGSVFYQEENLTVNTGHEMSVKSGDQVTLEPIIANQYSTFAGWTGVGVCSTGNCQFTMSGNTSATAAFNIDKDHSILVAPFYYHATLAAAYNASTTATGAKIKAWAINFAENLVFDKNKTVTLEGGYNVSHISRNPEDYSTITGSLRIRAGKVIADKITIK